MAIIKFIGSIHPPKTGDTYKVLKNTLKYITNNKKTANGLYVGSLNCMADSALNEMIYTNKHYGKEPTKQSDRVGYHFSISWSPEEKVTPEVAMEITEQFCESYLKGYEVVYSAHTDQNHMHTHICFNSVSCATGYKYRYENKDWEKIVQPILDKICKEKGLHTLEESTGMTLKEHSEERGKRKTYKKNDGAYKSHSNNKYEKQKETDFTWKDYIKNDIEKIILEVNSLDDALEKLKEYGYEIKQGNSKKYGTYLALKTKGMEKFKRTYSLGPEYTVEAIERRIHLKNKPLPAIPLEPGMQYVFVKRIYRLKVNYKTVNPVIKNYYKKLYRLGIMPKGGRKIDYKEIRERVKEIRKIEYQLKLISSKNLSSEEEVEETIKEKEVQISHLLEEKKKLQAEHKTYSKIIADYKKMKKLEGAYECYLAGDPAFKKEAELYQKLKSTLDAYNFTGDSLLEYEKQYREKLKEIRRKLKKENNEKESLTELRAEFAEKHALIELDESMLRELEKQSQEGKHEDEEIRREKRIL